MTTPLMRVDTTVNTNVKGSKVFGLAFVKVDGVTDSFTEAEVRAFVLPKLNTESAIVQLDNTSSGENYHSGRGDEIFTGILTKVFSNGIVDDTVTLDSADFATTGVNVYFLTMDGINNTAVKSVSSVRLISGLQNNEVYTHKMYIGDYNGSTYTDMSITYFPTAMFSNGKYIYKTVADENATIIVMSDKQTLYALGQNISFKLGTGDVKNTTNTTTYRACIIFNTFLTTNNLYIKDISIMDMGPVYLYTSDNKVYQIDVNNYTGLGATVNDTNNPPQEITFYTTYLGNNPTIELMYIRAIGRLTSAFVFKNNETGQIITHSNGLSISVITRNATTREWTLLNNLLNWNKTVSSSEPEYELIEITLVDKDCFAVMLKNKTSGEYEMFGTGGGRFAGTGGASFVRLTNCETFLNGIPNMVSWKLLDVPMWNDSTARFFFEITVNGTKEIYFYEYDKNIFTNGTRLPVNDNVLLTGDYVFSKSIVNNNNIMFSIRDQSVIPYTDTVVSLN